MSEATRLQLQFFGNFLSIQGKIEVVVEHVRDDVKELIRKTVKDYDVISTVTYRFSKYLGSCEKYNDRRWFEALHKFEEEGNEAMHYVETSRYDEQSLYRAIYVDKSLFSRFMDRLAAGQAYLNESARSRAA